MSVFDTLALSNSESYYYDSSDYSSYATSDENTAAAILLFGGFMIFALIFALIMYAVSAWLLGRIFKKAGLESWVSWVPVYNSWKLLELGGQPGWWAVLALIPIVNIVAAVFMIIAMYHVGLKLQKEGWFVLLAIFVPLVWMVWLAFDDSKWQGKKLSVAGPAAKKPETAETSEK
jgi:hypothetical protein